MAEEFTERVSRYILDGSDPDLRRLLSGAELGAENARTAFRRVGVQPGWNVIDCGCGPIGGPWRSWRRWSAPPGGSSASMSARRRSSGRERS